MFFVKIKMETRHVHKILMPLEQSPTTCMFKDSGNLSVCYLFIMIVTNGQTTYSEASVILVQSYGPVLKVFINKMHVHVITKER